MAYPSGNVLEISTGAGLNPGTYIAYGANQFSTDLSLSALVQRIYRDDAVFQIVSTPAQRNIGTLIWVPQGNGTRDVYYLEKVGQGGEKNWYLFSGLCYRLYNDQEGTDSILFPGFCLDAPDDDILKLSYDTPYLCDPVTVGVRHGRIFCRKSRHFMRVQDILMLYGRIPFSRYAAKERPGIFPH